VATAPVRIPSGRRHRGVLPPAVRPQLLRRREGEAGAQGTAAAGEEQGRPDGVPHKGGRGRLLFHRGGRLRRQAAEAVSSPPEEADCDGGRRVGSTSCSLPWSSSLPSVGASAGLGQRLEELSYPFVFEGYGRGLGNGVGFPVPTQSR
jgi:hypothetical protein